METLSKIFILFLFTTGGLLAQHDTISVTTNYPLNDPRNPNCPCHKLQKLADDEYKALQAQNSNTVQQAKQINHIDPVENKNQTGDDEQKYFPRQGSVNNVASSRNKRPVLKRLYFIAGRKWERIVPKRKNKPRHPDNCFCWNV